MITALLTILFAVSAYALGMQIVVVISFVGAIVTIWHLNKTIKELRERLVTLERKMVKLRQWGF